MFSITNCYSTGEITSGRVAGIAGFIQTYHDGAQYYFNITNCVALNPKVSTSAAHLAGRVAGDISGVGQVTYTNNYAISTMLDANNSVNWPADVKNGTNVLPATALTTSFWTSTMGWSTANWNIEAGKYPNFDFTYYHNILVSSAQSASTRIFMDNKWSLSAVGESKKNGSVVFSVNAGEHNTVTGISFTSPSAYMLPSLTGTHIFGDMTINNQAERNSVITLLEILDDRVSEHTSLLSAVSTLWTLTDYTNDLVHVKRAWYFLQLPGNVCSVSSLQSRAVRYSNQPILSAVI